MEITKVIDDYLLTEDDNEFIFGFECRNKRYETKLQKGLFLDYNFLKPIIKATQLSESGGSFYLVDDERLCDGYCFMYLDDSEYQTVIDKNLIRVTKLTETVVDEINIWVK